MSCGKELALDEGITKTCNMFIFLRGHVKWAAICKQKVQKFGTLRCGAESDGYNESGGSLYWLVPL